MVQLYTREDMKRIDQAYADLFGSIRCWFWRLLAFAILAAASADLLFVAYREVCKP